MEQKNNYSDRLSFIKSEIEAIEKESGGDVVVISEPVLKVVLVLDESKSKS